MVIGGHAHSGYDEALNEILNEVTSMGAKTDALLGMAADALHGNIAQHDIVKVTDKEVNRLEYDISEQLHFILTRYTPSVHELRFLTSLIKIAGSLERIGDVAKETVEELADHKTDHSQSDEYAELLPLLDTGREMLRTSMDHIQNYSPDTMTTVVKKEKYVIEQSDRLLSDVLHKAASKDISAEYASLITLLIRNVERLADHSIDILRMSFYAHTGKRLKRKKLLSD